MPSRRIFRRDIASACSEVGENDGRDPRYDKEGSPAKVKNRKALQLCAQVAETLALVLADDADDLLRELRVEQVVPAPSTAQMLVTLSVPDLGEDVTQEVIRALLAAVETRLRVEVGNAIYRRRVPQLFYNLVRRQ